MLNLVGPVIPVATEPEGDPASYQADARRQLDELRQFTEEQKFAQKQATTEIEQTLSGVRKAAGQVGVSTHKRLFEIEANKQERVSQAWLNWTAGFAAITLGYAIAAAIGPAGFLALPTESDVAASVQLAVAKILIFTVLISAVIWTGRNYRALRHNSVVNRHRQIALDSFETFAAAASEEVTRNAVLLRATQAIFDLQPSGYISQDSDTSSARRKCLKSLETR